MARRCLLHAVSSPVPYATAWRWQRALMARAIDAQRAGESGSHPDTLLVVEHPPVYTLGRGSTLENVRTSLEGIPADLVRVERGGEVTYHGPGQVVVYPILDLTQHRKDLHWYLRQMEGAVIDALATYGVRAHRDDAGTGVWVGDGKIAAVGLSASRWVTMHGLALNVDADLAAFEHIVPCGIRGRRVTSLRDVLLAGAPPGQEEGALLQSQQQQQQQRQQGAVAAAPSLPPAQDVRQVLVRALSRRFGLDIFPSPHTDRDATARVVLAGDPDEHLDDLQWFEKHQRPL
jgi:lipoyl(octanoyl) transferase